MFDKNRFSVILSTMVDKIQMAGKGLETRESKSPRYSGDSLIHEAAYLA